MLTTSYVYTNNPHISSEELKELTSTNNPQYFAITFVGDSNQQGTINASRKTYQKIIGSNYRRSVNEFFKTLSVEEQKVLFFYYEEMIKQIWSINKDNIVSVIDLMESYTTSVLGKLDIIGKLDTFVNNNQNIPFPDLSKIGLRDRDSKEMTFYLEEYKQLTGFCILCKLMGPIWGELIAHLQTGDKNITNNENREPYCLRLIISLIENSIYNTVYQKLTNYMITIIKRYVNFNDVDSNIIFVMANSGMSEDRYYEVVIATVIVKKLVPYNIWDGPIDALTGIKSVPDIMRHIASSTRDNGENKYRSLNSSSSIMTRFQPSDQDDDKDKSYFDIGALISRNTADTPTIMTVGFASDVKRFLKTNNIDPAVFESMADFYYRKRVGISPFNKAIMASILVRYLNNPSVVLKHLSFADYTKLIILTQMIMVKTCPMILSLIPFVSSEYSEKEADEYSTVDRILLSDRIKDNTCFQTFPGSVGNVIVEYNNGIHTGKIKKTKESTITIKTQIGMMLTWLVEHKHQICMPTELWEYMNMEQVPNGSELLTYDRLTSDICHFFSNTHYHQKQ